MVAPFDAASGRLVNATAEYAAKDPVKRFGTGEEPFDDYQTNNNYPKIYLLAQCTPDMSASDCRNCLGDIIRTMTPKYFTGKHGGRVFGVRCNFRFETYAFFSGAPLLQLSGELDQGRPLGYHTPLSWMTFKPSIRSFSTYRHYEQQQIISLKPISFGEGGFGSVYKGVLSEGLEIAVKRLALGSGQDSQKNKDLDWGKRLKIVNGVARGLQYLHEESQLKIVHRDLKPSNVLLDFDYNPKISDFGLAKLFDMDQSQGVTSHIAGTYGYMAPEYAMRGQYSVKSDVFSLGVLVLEIITGRKNSSSFGTSEESVDLLSLVWEHWSMGTIEEMLDPLLVRRAPQDQMVKLVNIGLLCVQDIPADRPTMSSVNVMLSSNTVSLQAPSRPTFCIQDMEGDLEGSSDAYPRAFQSTSKSKATASPNEVSLTELEPR
ncbi:hypothetical protein EJB05_32913, partial [Eragrostis curvula]